MQISLWALVSNAAATDVAAVLHGLPKLQCNLRLLAPLNNSSWCANQSDGTAVVPVKTALHAANGAVVSYALNGAVQWINIDRSAAWTALAFSHAAEEEIMLRMVSNVLSHQIHYSCTFLSGCRDTSFGHSSVAYQFDVGLLCWGRIEFRVSCD